MELLKESLAAGIIPGLIVAIYLIINKIIDSKKEIKQAKVSEDLVLAINKLINFVDNVTKNILEKDNEKNTVGIESILTSNVKVILEFVISTIINNNIEKKKKIIISNITEIINDEFYKSRHAINIYTNRSDANTVVKKEWKDEIINFIISNLFNTVMSKEDRIIIITKGLNIKFNNYKTFIKNNTNVTFN